MTAEVAILNRTAVTLAADSAVSIGDSDVTTKIYNNIDKIFELSTHDPIGLMVYNNLEFMGIPLEVIIKRFRASDQCTKCRTMQEASTIFFDHLLTLIGTDEDQHNHIQALSVEWFVEFRRLFDHRMRELVRSAANKTRPTVNGRQVFDDTCREVIGELEKMPESPSLAPSTWEIIRDFHVDPINRAMAQVFRAMPITENQRDSLRKIAALYLHRDILSERAIGFVFAGFAGDDLFPSLCTFELDGAVAGKLKLTEGQFVTIDRSRVAAEIVPFAQREMVDRFITGVDPDFEEEIPKYLSTAIDSTGKSIIASVGTLTTAQRRDLEQKLKSAVDIAVEQFKADGIDKIKTTNRQQIYDMVAFMPKQELADFAESLVNLTSIKRKVSPEQETVGGVIDVAVISRGDGFVWVKRKHYFEAKLNPRFFRRKYGIVLHAAGGEGAGE